jgi:predicted DNA-binding WGR domain protein
VPRTIADVRRFELSEGTSNKFWQIALDGAAFTVTWGRIGTNGQTQTKTFDSPSISMK